MTSTNQAITVPTGATEPSRNTIQKDNETRITSTNEIQSNNNLPAIAIPIEISEPRIGMEFEDDEKAYVFYNSYARRVGFSVRKQNMTRGKTGVVRLRRYVCSKEGYYKTEPTDKGGSYSRTDLRTGCNAHIGIKRLKSGRYCIHRFIPEHNHPLVSSKKVHLLRSQREYNTNNSNNNNNNQREVTTEEGATNNITTPNNCNYLHGLRQFEMRPGDAGTMLYYLQKKSAQDLGFYFAVQLDSKDQITNLFWRDARSKIDYHYFGDALCFDTTYKLNGYDRPFVVFLGVNHHKQVMIFGSGFLYNDSIESFKWLFQTFRESMGGKAPNLVLTDQDQSVMNAVREIWPDSDHSLCAWHMYQNAAKNLSHVFQAHPGFEIELKKCFYECEYEDEFVGLWQNLVQSYNLVDNAFLKTLFEDRREWALVYQRDVFCADIYDSLKNEHVHGSIKSGLNRERDLLPFFNRYDRILKDKRYSELEADYKATRMANLNPLSRLLKQAASVYTPKVYETVSKEFELFVDCVVQNCGPDGTDFVYEVTNVEKKQTAYVRHETSGDTLSCTCKKFECVGVLCSHVLKVLDYKNIKEIPEKYVIRRWRKDVKSGVNLEFYDESDEIDPTSAIENRYNSLGKVFQQIIAKGSECQEAYSVAMKEASKIMERVEFAIRSRVWNDMNSGSSENEGEEGGVRVRRRRRRNQKGSEDGASASKKKERESVCGGSKGMGENSAERKGRQGQCNDPVPHLEDATNSYNPWPSVGYLSLQFPTMNQEPFVTSSTQQPFCLTGQTHQNSSSSPFIINPHSHVGSTFPPELSER